MKNKKFDFLIVGAGLYGSTMAYILKKDYNVLVIEKRKHVGGNIYDEKVNGINVHKYGPHIFHTSNSMVWEFINKFTEFIPFINSPIANYNGELYSLPFNMYTFNKMWRVNTPKEALLKIEEQKRMADVSEQPKNLEEKAISMVGLDIYRKLIKGYTEKQWGKDCKELPPSIINRLPVRFTYNNNYYNDVYQGIPKDGYTNIIMNMLDGVNIILGVDYIDQRKRFNDIARKVIYTGMIDRYFDYRLGHLQYRSVNFEEEIIPNIRNYQGNAVINYTDVSVPYTRIIEHKHFLPELKDGYFNGTIITREYPGGGEECYPINDSKNNKLYKEYYNLARDEKDVYFGGRLAEYKYYDMDDVVCKAIVDSIFIKQKI